MRNDKAIAFKDARPGNVIKFVSGYYMTGTVVKIVGTHNGMKMIEFQNEETGRVQIISYAAHRTVILLDV